MAVAAAGCSDDDSADPTLPPVDSTAASSTATTTTTPTTSPTASTTTSTTSTSAPVDTTASTSTSSSVIDITPPERDAIVASWRELVQASRACFRSPATCDRASIERLAAGTYGPAVLSVVDQKLAEGEISIEGQTPSYAVLVDVVVNDDAATGSVTSCSVDGDIDVLPNNPDDPADDVIVSDRVISRIWTHTYELIDGSWKATSVEDQQVWEGENRCPPPEG